MVKDSARTHCRKLVQLTRDDNQKALSVMKSQGINFVPPTADQLKSFRSDAQKTYAQSIPKLYPRKLFERIQAILNTLRL